MTEPGFFLVPLDTALSAKRRAAAKGKQHAMSPHDPNAPTRKAAKVLDSNLEITLQLQVTGRLVRNTPAKNSMRLLVLKDFVIRHPFTRTSGIGEAKTAIDEVGRVAIRENGSELWIAAGEQERIPYSGLTKDDKKRLGTLSAKDHSELLADQPEEERALLLKQLLSSIRPELRNQVMEEASNSPNQGDSSREPKPRESA